MGLTRSEPKKLISVGNIAEGAGVKVFVDPAKCQGHNRCVVAAPDLFEIDDLGYSHAIGTSDVPPEREEAARLAVANCPERAISLVEQKANVR